MCGRSFAGKRNCLRSVQKIHMSIWGATPACPRTEDFQKALALSVVPFIPIGRIGREFFAGSGPRAEAVRGSGGIYLAAEPSEQVRQKELGRRPARTARQQNPLLTNLHLLPALSDRIADVPLDAGHAHAAALGHFWRTCSDGSAARYIPPRPLTASARGPLPAKNSLPIRKGTIGSAAPIEDGRSRMTLRVGIL